MNSIKLWFSKIFQNKIIIFSLLGIVVVGGSLLTYSLVKDGKGENSLETSLDTEFREEELVPGEPYLLLKILDYPQSVNDFCQDVVIKFEAENVGDTVLKYSDLGNKYYFRITSDSSLTSFGGSAPVDTIATTEDYSTSFNLTPYTKTLTDFGEIAPGEKKVISFNCISYVTVDAHEYFWVNGFFNVDNGSADYYVQFGKISEKGMFYSSGISDSPTVSITTGIKDSDGGQKYCEYEVIKDMSIDLDQSI